MGHVQTEPPGGGEQRQSESGPHPEEAGAVKCEVPASLGLQVQCSRCSKGYGETQMMCSVTQVVWTVLGDQGPCR